MCGQLQYETAKPANSIKWVKAHLFHLIVAVSNLIRSESRKPSVCLPPVGLCLNYIKIFLCDGIHISSLKHSFSPLLLVFLK